MRDPHVRFCERRGGAIRRAYSTNLRVHTNEDCFAAPVMTVGPGVLRHNASGYQVADGRRRSDNGRNIGG